MSAMCKYCETDEAGNLTYIEEDDNCLFTYLEDYGTEWALVTEMNTRCYGEDCWSTHRIIVNNCPMCGRKLPTSLEVSE